MNVATRTRRPIRVHPAQQTLWTTPPWATFTRYTSELGAYDIGGLDPADLALTPTDLAARTGPAGRTAEPAADRPPPGPPPPPGPWRALAVCRGLDTSLFFPPREGAAELAAARAICHTCPAQAACAEYAIVNHVRHGVWGATSERQRRRIRAARRQGAA